MDESKKEFKRFFNKIFLTIFLLLISKNKLKADEQGDSAWFAGNFPSFAAKSETPGWHLGTLIYYIGGKAPPNEEFNTGYTVAKGLESQYPLLFLLPTYVPDTKWFGGRPSFLVEWGAGFSQNSVNVLSTNPNTQYNYMESIWGITDFYPLFTLTWDLNLHNWMTYLYGVLPSGAYNPNRLTNISIGHGAVDIGGGYTYYNVETGHEFSAVLGVTYNLENTKTNYQNGLDAHLDFALSRVFKDLWQAGIVGYLYYQFTGDTGSGATLGSFESRAFALGLEGGKFFKVDGKEWYGNLRAYFNLWEQNRINGIAVYAQITIPLKEFGK